MATGINTVLMQFEKRAEGVSPEVLVKTFVDAGPLFTLLSSRDHQVIYGRRGTGKTHALIYLGERNNEKGDLSSYIDFRLLGSNGGIYADPNISLAERATRLLADTLLAIQDSVLQVVTARPEEFDSSKCVPLLDQLAEAATEVAVKGNVSDEILESTSESSKSSSDAHINLSLSSPALQISGSDSNEAAANSQRKFARSGVQTHRVHFGTVGKVLSQLTGTLGGRRLWVLLDEWSVVPIDLQPYLADLIRRAILPVKGVSVKIGAIEQRTNFKVAGAKGDYIGIELGADVSADVNLDDFMVFDNDADRAIGFFKEFLFKHATAVFSANKLTDIPISSQTLIQSAFTQHNAFEEFVRAAEGVPRDAMYIASLAAQKAVDGPIAIDHVRSAARSWYQRDKEASITSNRIAHNLLHWTIKKVIAHRRARAFLLRSNIRYEPIDDLFDARLLHLLKRNIAAHDQPGIRYDVYKIDYGCYVDLLTTAKAPLGLLPEDEASSGEPRFVDVPPDDYRAIRRAILNLDEFTGSMDSKVLDY